MIVNVQHRWEMHCHSRFSDGRLSPEALLAEAQAKGVEHLALTDHDTARGYRYAVDQQLVPPGLTLYPGAEMSCLWHGRTLHIVGLGMDVYSDTWLAVEADLDQRRRRRFDRIIELLVRAGFELDVEQILQRAEFGVPARPHIADYLVETGQVSSLGSVYKRWLGQGKVGDVKQQWPELGETIDAIHRSGGMAVLAHPHRYKLTWTKARELLDDFTDAGGEAVEIACAGLHPDLRKFLVNQARERHLWVGGGSDFHGPEQKWISLGRYPSWPLDVPLVQDWLANQNAPVQSAVQAGNCSAVGLK
ncbi:PHP domain-containing protein [Reinekea blandensis]|uniref:Predicted metal-dependent phosphoesterase (PHP family) protein n=1 Tax=Reinekea blandensis MED297 TaxID=314283 RepID=A4BCE4_9GAMM|nr:PHP domain-containing protein [Reinekea blandensis]EAR10210.1 predicted metal-dependent phosphoesterase (PHP family) protein [Reinekea sp. MED297] [Reinekea blandensis MED297]